MHPQTVLADFRTVAIDQLRESRTNPRRSFDPDKLQELAQSIRAQGVLVPLIVRNIAAEEYEVVAGARRFRAAQAAELFSVPVRVVELSDAEALTLSWLRTPSVKMYTPWKKPRISCAFGYARAEIRRGVDRAQSRQERRSRLRSVEIRRSY